MDVSTKIWHAVLRTSMLVMYLLLYTAEISEAVDSTSPIVRYAATSNKLTVEMMENSSCTESFNRLCHKKADGESCSSLLFQEGRSISNSTLIIHDLQPNTPYILKTDNDSLSDCDVEMLTCPEQPPTALNVHAEVEALTKRLDVKWSLPQEQCRSEQISLVRYKSQNSPFTQWKDVNGIKCTFHESCRKQISIALNESPYGKNYTVQVRVEREGEERHAVAQPVETHVRVHALQSISGSWKPAWLDGVWVAVGAAGGLAIVLVGICCFDKRWKWKDAETSTNQSIVTPQRPNPQMESLGLDFDLLVDSEYDPDRTPPSPEHLMPNMNSTSPFYIRVA